MDSDAKFSTKKSQYRDLTSQAQSSFQGTFGGWTDFKVLLTKAAEGEAGM